MTCSPNGKQPNTVAIRVSAGTFNGVQRGFIPSGLANEIMLDVFLRPESFEPEVDSVQQRIFDACA